MTRTRRLSAAAALLLGAPLAIPLFTGNHRLGAVPETISTGLTAHALAREQTVDITPYFPRTPRPDATRYSIRGRQGQLYSIEPLASSMTFAPFFLRFRDLPPPSVRLRWRLFNQVAAEVAVATLVLIGLWLLQHAPAGRVLLVVGVIGLATCFRTINGAGLWQHTSGALWLAAGLGLWAAATTRHRLYPLAGAALAIATACRPILVPAALALIVDAARSAGLRSRPTRVAAAMVIGIGSLALVANWLLHGSVLGGRAAIVGEIVTSHRVPAYFDFSLAHLAGLLVSPSRGLFVYSPVLLFAIPGLIRGLGRAAPPTVRAMTTAGLLTLLLYGFIATWWAGWVFGSRYMADLLPFFALWLALAPHPTRRRSLWTLLFVCTLAWSLAVQQLGVSTYPCRWNAWPVSVDQAPERAWSVRDTQIGRCVSLLLHRGSST